VHRDDLRAARRGETGSGGGEGRLGPRKEKGRKKETFVKAIELKTDAMIVAMVVAVSTLAWAQGAPAAAAPVHPPAVGAKPATPEAVQPPSPTPESYTYDPAGRRDPFVSLIARGVDSAPGKKVFGLSGIPTADVVLRGVLQSKGSYVALLSGSDGKTFQGRVDDRLLDGVIRSVAPTGIVIMQEVNDPLSLIKQREVRKGLRTVEDGK
jgi:type IV pilus assembly protein PilP